MQNKGTAEPSVRSGIPRRRTLLLLLLLVPAALHAATYYVDANHGHDEAVGTSASQPWQTLHRVQMVALQPGDRVLLRRGATWRESLDLRYSGNADKPITIASYGDGPKPVITANDVLERWERVAPKIWRTSIGWKPLQVFRDSVRVKKAETATALKSQEYVLLGDQLYVFSSAEPNDRVGWEASRRLYALNLENVAFVSIEDLDLRSNNSNGYAVLRIAASRPMSSLAIMNTDVSQGASSCIYVKNDPGAAIDGISFVQVFAHHCAALTSSAGGLMFGANGGQPTAHVTISNTRVAYNGVDENTRRDPIPVFGIDLANVHHAVLQVTEADHNGSSGIDIQKGSTDIIIRGGSSHDNGLAARGDRNGIAIGGYDGGSSQIQIIGVDVYNNTSANIEIDSTDKDEVCSDITITNSQIHGSKGSGIQLGGGHRGVTITGNRVENNGRYGIALFAGRSGSPQALLSDNLIINNAKDDSGAVNLFLGSSKVVLKNNTVQNTITH
jgi:hypothetical protein